jgi:hypothetical protein
MLADEFMVASYDRRGTGFARPCPAGAGDDITAGAGLDDAAGLGDCAGDRPRAAFGTSSAGGNLRCAKLVRHPGWVRGAVLHEPGLCLGR